MTSQHAHAGEADKTYKVLFPCTGNSARSILAEAILNQHGQGRFRAFSAGSYPKGEVHPAAINLLVELGQSTKECRSKSWDEFAHPGAPQLMQIGKTSDAEASVG